MHFNKKRWIMAYLSKLHQESAQLTFHDWSDLCTGGACYWLLEFRELWKALRPRRERLELIRRKDGSIVSISKISEVIVSSYSSLVMWNLQLYNNSFEWKNVTFSVGVKTYSDPSYILLGGHDPNLQDLRPWKMILVNFLQVLLIKLSRVLHIVW